MVSSKFGGFWRMFVFLPCLWFSKRSYTVVDMVNAFGGQMTQWNTRLIGFICVTGVTLLHAFQLKWGLRIQNALAIAKIGTMLFIILSGLLAFLGWIPLVTIPHNFDKFWEGTNWDPNTLVTALYNVIWCEPLQFR